MSLVCKTSSKDSGAGSAPVDSIEARKACLLSKSTDFRASGGPNDKAAQVAAQQALRKQQGKNKEEELQKIKENLSLEVKNYQRKTLLSGIGQQETLSEHHDLVQQAIAQGISPIAVSNFKGKEVLDNLRGLKVVYDKDYFNK